MYAQPSWTRRRHPRTVRGIAPRRSGSTASREPYASCPIWYATVPPKRELAEPGERCGSDHRVAALAPSGFGHRPPAECSHRLGDDGPGLGPSWSSRRINERVLCDEAVREDQLGGTRFWFSRPSTLTTLRRPSGGSEWPFVDELGESGQSDASAAVMTRLDARGAADVADVRGSGGTARRAPCRDRAAPRVRLGRGLPAGLPAGAGRRPRRSPRNTATCSWPGSRRRSGDAHAEGADG